MSVFRVEKTRDYTVMANHHLKNRNLTLKAKGLLSLMLSLPEDWDYTLKGLSLISIESVDAIREAVRELERAGYILRSRERNVKGQLKGSDYVIYEQPHLQDAEPTLEKPTLEKPTLGNPVQEKPILEQPTQDNPTQLNTNKVNTYSEIPHKANPNQSNPSQASKPSWIPRNVGSDMIGFDEPESIRKIVKDNISYATLLQNRKAGKERLEEIVELIVETLCSSKPMICISGDDYPSALVKEKFMKISSPHIEYVFDCLDRNTTYIRNIKKYLLATLFNAPSTIDSYYAALVNHDMYGDGSRGTKADADRF